MQILNEKEGNFVINGILGVLNKNLLSLYQVYLDVFAWFLSMLALISIDPPFLGHLVAILQEQLIHESLQA
jgi:hypothetical protein